MRFPRDGPAGGLVAHRAPAPTPGRGLHVGVGHPSAMIALADVAVVVSDAKASARWWKKNLGFSSYTIGGGGHAILVAPPGERYVLHLCEGFAPLEPGNTGIAFVTDAIETTVARMQKGGVQFPEPMSQEEWGRMAKFADPDGNVFWLLETPTAMVRATLKSRAPVRAARPRKPSRPRRRAPASTRRARRSGA
jgi:predicted enzyme related to lactoylglutathione lyase